MKPEKVYSMKISKVYPLLVQKAMNKGRSKEEVDQVTCWLTGYDQKGLDQQLKMEVSYKTFFGEAPYYVIIKYVQKLWNKNVHMISSISLERRLINDHQNQYHS